MRAHIEDLRSEYIKIGFIIPNAVPVESVDCKRCETPFERITGYRGNVCGYCEYQKKKPKEDQPEVTTKAAPVKINLNQRTAKKGE